MIEAFVVIACAIFVGMTLYATATVAILMNKKFIGWYIGRIAEVTEEAMEKAREAQEEQI